MTKKELKAITKLLNEGTSEIDITYRYGYLKSIVKAVKRQVDKENTTPRWRQMRLFE